MRVLVTVSMSDATDMFTSHFSLIVGYRSSGRDFGASGMDGMDRHTQVNGGTWK